MLKMEVSGRRYAKAKGAQLRPITVDNEKFMVAKAERKSPRTNKDEDFVRVYSSAEIWPTIAGASREKSSGDTVKIVVRSVKAELSTLRGISTTLANPEDIFLPGSGAGSASIEVLNQIRELRRPTKGVG